MGERYTQASNRWERSHFRRSYAYLFDQCLQLTSGRLFT